MFVLESLCCNIPFSFCSCVEIVLITKLLVSRSEITMHEISTGAVTWITVISIHLRLYIFSLIWRRMLCRASKEASPWFQSGWNVLYKSTGPLSKTIVDFWRLVWQERCPTIVMVTNLKERNRTKCEQYWPDSGSQEFGPFQVTLSDQQILSDYTTRSLQVEVSANSNSSTRNSLIIVCCT